MSIGLPTTGTMKISVSAGGKSVIIYIFKVIVWRLIEAAGRAGLIRGIRVTFLINIYNIKYYIKLKNTFYTMFNERKRKGD